MLTAPAEAASMAIAMPVFMLPGEPKHRALVSNPRVA